MSELRKKERMLRETAEAMRTEPEQLPVIIQKFQRELLETRKEIAKLKGGE